MSEECHLNLGSNCLNIIMQENDLFIRSVVSDGLTDKRVEISLKGEYSNKLISSSITITQLPMLIPPVDIYEENGKYYPPCLALTARQGKGYMEPEIYHFYNTFDTVINNKFSNRITAKNESTLYKTIRYLNNIRFSINKDMLNFVIRE